MIRRRILPVLAGLTALTGVTLLASSAFAQATEARVKDQPEEGQGTEEVPAHDKDPFRGSTFLFDQSAATQSLHLDNAEQSYDGFYAWWLSLRPRYNFDDHWRVQARIDYYKEFTNSQDTTYYREDVFGDIWTDFIYSTPLAKEGRWKNTKVSAGLRALWPTSKQSQANGLYVTLGATAGISQKIPINGADAKALNSARLGLSFAYLHQFTQSTTAANYGGFAGAPGEGVGDSGLNPTSNYAFATDQITGQTLVEHQLYGILDGGLQITPKLGMTLDWILINNWHYAPSKACVATPTGAVCPGTTGVTSGTDQQFTQLGWFVASADYEIVPEMSIGLGYYNLSNIVATDGQLRGPFSAGFNNVFWSPDARVFLDVTANLDKIFEDASGKYKSGSTSQTAREVRQQSIISGQR
ncbi:MAG TPA: hypothetical protein VGL81_36230 [Polyangiaceae bacterium]